jgi:hypothetical protein
MRSAIRGLRSTTDEEEMMRRRLTADEHDRQLPLLPVPLYAVEPPQVQIEDPLPEAMPIAEDDGLRSRLLHAPGDASPEGRAWVAVLRAHGEIVWQCRHLHRSEDGALACGWQARGIGAAGPAGKGVGTE